MGTPFAPAENAQSARRRPLRPELILRHGCAHQCFQMQPQSLTIIASADTGNTYPIAVVPGTATELVWSPYEVEETYTIPWAVTSYTATIWDERGPTATPTGGRMTVNRDIKFALYRPAAYTPLSCRSLWQCLMRRPADRLSSRSQLLLSSLDVRFMLISK